MSKAQKIAITAAVTLGDALLTQLIAYNFLRNDYQVDVYSNFIAQLQDWLPEGERAFPLPSVTEFPACFSQYDFVLADADLAMLGQQAGLSLSELAKQFIFYSNSAMPKELARTADYVIKAQRKKNSIYDERASMVDNTMLFCQKVLDLKNVVKENGLRAPENLQHRKYHQRVILHPLSTREKKNWSAVQYLQLARALKKLGYEPVFIASPKEREIWCPIVKDEFATPLFENVAALAAFVYESAWMIGNDSGIGHLASNLGLPTLSIYGKHNYYRWRPAWAPGKVLKPIWYARFFARDYWWRFVSVSRVLCQFKKLVKEDS